MIRHPEAGARGMLQATPAIPMILLVFVHEQHAVSYMQHACCIK